MTTTRAGTFITEDGPTNGATVLAYKRARFGAFPAADTLPPSGTADAGPVTTGVQYGAPGAYAITLPTNEDYYIVVEYLGSHYWYLSSEATFDDSNGQTLTLVTTPGGPTISSFSPTSGSVVGGDTITITGTNLSGAAAVTFGTTSVTSFVSNTSTQIVVLSPSEVAGAVNLSVTTPVGTVVATQQYQYTAAPVPTITSYSPTSGSTAGGTDVTITGTNLANATSVTFGADPAVIGTDTSGTLAVVTTPAQSAGFVNLTVTTSQGSATATTQYQYLAAPPPTPTISSISPIAGPLTSGNTVTINGTNLGNPTSVTFGGVAASVFTTLSSATKLVVAAPAGSAGAADVVVTTAGGSVTDSAAYTYQAAPTITSYTNSSQTIGSLVNCVITGTHFDNFVDVLVNGLVCVIVGSPTSTSITFTPPALAAGSYNVQVQTLAGTVTAATPITYGTSTPTISSFNPTSGLTGGGLAVTLTGTNFTGATSVKFGTAAASFSVTNSTTIAATSPAGTPGTVNISVTTPGGTATSSGVFTYTGAGNPVKIMVLALENLGQQDFSAATSGEMGSLMSSYTYAGSLSLGHDSAPNYVQLFSAINCHDPFKPGTQSGGQTIYTGGTANPTYSVNGVNDYTSGSGPQINQFDGAATIFSLVQAAGKTNYVYYDTGTTAHRDPLQFFPSLSGSPVSLPTRTAASNTTSAMGTLISAHLDTDNPDFIYVLPNDTNNGHNDGNLTGHVNAFLTSTVGAVQATQWYKNGGIIFIWWDEDNSYGSDSTTATWVALGQGSNAAEGGAGGYLWNTSVSLQTAVTGGSNLTGGPSYTVNGFQVGMTGADIVYSICTALGLNPAGLTGASSYSSITTARNFPGLFPALGAPGGGTGSPPAMPSGNQTVTVDGTPLTFAPAWSDSFAGTTLSSRWGHYSGSAPGAPNSTYDPTYSVVNNGLTTMAALTATGTATGGIFGTSQMSPATTGKIMVDWAIKILTNIPSLVSYGLWWPQNNSDWPHKQEFDLYENNGTGTVSHQTTHGGSAANPTSNYAWGANNGHGLTTHNFNQWTYCRGIWTANTVQFWAGNDVNSLTLQSEITAANLADGTSVLLSGSGPSTASIFGSTGTNIDTSNHVFDMATEWESGSAQPSSGLTSTPIPIMQVAWVVVYT